LLGKRGIKTKASQEEEDLAVEFWNEVAKNIPEWQMILANKASSGELRKQYVHAHGIILQALGCYGS
jgi:DNA sulfur modification protein DndB